LSYLSAVQKGRVFTVPNLPFNWIDKPASVNRLGGLMYLQYMTMSDYKDTDFYEQVKKFYLTFYHLEIKIEMSDTEMKLTPSQVVYKAE
jgi:iron complex transport system substrate-binding protein